MRVIKQEGFGTKKAVGHPVNISYGNTLSRNTEDPMGQFGAPAGELMVEWRCALLFINAKVRFSAIAI